MGYFLNNSSDIINIVDENESYIIFSKFLIIY